jgi:hypothetical protein
MWRFADHTEGVIELFSHRADRISQIVSAFIVGDSGGKPGTQFKKTLTIVRGRDFERTHA